MRFPRMKPRFWILGIALSCATLLFSAPVWLPWILVPSLGKLGATVASYEKIGYTRFALNDLAWDDKADGVHFKAHRIECPTPLFLVISLLEKGSKHPLLIEKWELSIPKPEALESSNATDEEDASPVALAHRVHDTLRWIAPWLIDSKLTQGKFTLYEQTFYLPRISWKDRVLSAEGITQRSSEPFSFTIKDLGTSHTHFLITLPRKDLQLKGESILGEDALSVESTLTLGDNQLSGSCLFEDDHIYPAKAELKAQDFVIQDTIVMVDGYKPWTLNLDALWDKGTYSLNLTGEALSQKEKAPPLTAQLKAHGTLKQFYLDAFSLNAKEVTSSLNENKDREANVHFTINLDAVDFLPATGSIKGDLFFKDIPDSPIPAASLKLAGKSVTFLGEPVKTLAVKGELGWPTTQVKQCSIKMDKGSALEFSGKINIEEQTFENCTLALDLKQKFLALLLEGSPAALSASSFNASLNGPWTRPNYTAQGSVASLDLEHFYPLSGTFNAQGTGAHITNTTLNLTTEQSGALDVSGEASFTKNSLNLKLLSGSFSGENRHTLALEEPTVVRLKWSLPGGNSAQKTNNTFDLKNITLKAKEGTTLKASLQLEKMKSGSIQLNVEKWVKTALPLTLKMPEWTKDTEIDNLALTANWDDSPITFSFKTEGAYTIEGDKEPLLLSIETQGNKKGIEIKTCTFNRAQETILSGQGILPLTITPSNPENTLAFIRKAPIKFTFSSTPAPVFWEQFGSLTGIYLKDPTIDLKIKGSPDRPDGMLNLDAASIKLEKQDWPKLPQMESLDIDLTLSPQGLSIKQGSLLIEGEPASITGTLPWNKDADTPFTPEIKGARLNVNMEKAPMNTFRPWLPDFVKNEGYAKAIFTVSPPLKIKGSLQIEGAATYPINPVGSVREIQANIEFEESHIQIKTLQGMLSEHPLSLKGAVDISDEKNPKFDLSLQGKSIPLIREPGVIVRGDIDLTVKTEKDTVLAGDIKLMDSVLLMDLGELVASVRTAKTSSSSSAGITTKPFSEWKLDVELEGKDFMRIRTPIFESRLSANIDLGGQLKEPIPSGTLTLHGGYVKFPFATLEVSSGTVTLPKGDPFNALLNISAKGRTYGYDIKLDVKGTAEEPQLIFSSSPSLESGEILLLVSTGRLPDDDSDTGKQLGTLGVFLGGNILSELGMDDSSFQNRVKVKVGEDVTEAGKDTIEVDYKLSDRWSIIGQYDRFDEYDLDFKVRVYSK